jgi:hypothetical protein
MAPGMVTNCRISHFLYEATAMMLAQLLEKHGPGARVEGAKAICDGVSVPAKSDAVAILLEDALKFCLDEAHKASHDCSSGSLCWPSPIYEHVRRGFAVTDASAGTCGEP